MNSTQELIVYVVAIIAILACAIAYSVWQFNLCYPAVSDNFWYCFQHAW